MFGQVCQNLICKGYLAHIVFFALNMHSSSFAGQPYNYNSYILFTFFHNHYPIVDFHISMPLWFDSPYLSQVCNDN